jgi:hypothetical protein
LVTKLPFVGRRAIDQRHHCDYGFRWSELRAVDFTAASKGNFSMLAVDATDCRF